MKSSNKIISLILALFLVLGLGLSPVAKVQAEETVTREKGVFEQLFSTDWMTLYQGASQQAGGFESIVEFTLGEGLLMGATERQMLEDLNYRIKYLQIPNEDPLNAQSQLEIAMMNPNEPEKELAMILYNVGEQAVIEIPRILDKAIFLSEEAFAELSAGYTGADTIAGLPENVEYTMLPMAMQNLVGEFALNFEDQGDQLVTLTIDQITETLTASVKLLPAEKLYPALQTLLERVRDSEEFAPLLEALQEQADAEALQYSYEETTDIREELEQAIQNLQDEAATNDIAVTLVELFDEQGNHRGYRVSFDSAQAGESILFEAYGLEEPTSMTSAFTIKLSMVEGGYAQEIMAFTGTAVPNAEGLFTVNLLLNAFNEETLEYEKLMDGVISNLLIIDSEIPEQAIFEADVDINLYTFEYQEVVYELDDINNENEDTEDLEIPVEDPEAPGIDENATATVDLDYYDFEYEMVSIIVNLKGRIETHGKTSVVDLTLVPDNNLENQYIKIKVQTSLLDPAQIVVPTELPQEYYDLDKDEDMEFLQTDETIQQNLMQALQDLGLMPAGAPQQP